MSQRTMPVKLINCSSLARSQQQSTKPANIPSHNPLGTPFSTGRTNDDCSAYLASRSKIPSCTDNIYPHHKALCYCKDESAGAWFHGDATVLLESGLPKRFSELSLGDRIRTSDGQGSFSFSPVLTLPHANNSEPAVFLTLTTETGKKVDLTSDRLVPKCDRSEITAGGLMVGDCVFTVDGKETLLEISLTAKKGTFTATTQDKFIVVNGVVALSYPTKPELELKLEEITLFEKRDHKLPRPRASGHKKRLRLRAYEQNPL